MEFMSFQEYDSFINVQMQLAGKSMDEEDYMSTLKYCNEIIRQYYYLKLSNRLEEYMAFEYAKKATRLCQKLLNYMNAPDSIHTGEIEYSNYPIQ